MKFTPGDEREQRSFIQAMAEEDQRQAELAEHVRGMPDEFIRAVVGALLFETNTGTDESPEYMDPEAHREYVAMRANLALAAFATTLLKLRAKDAEDAEIQ